MGSVNSNDPRHLRHLSQARLDREAVVTIGVFDGVHLGHQRLARRLAVHAREQGLLAVALTFFPHPDKTLRDVAPRYYLTSPETRARLLLDCGLDLVVTHPFDKATRHLSAAEFVDELVRSLRMRELWVGADFALGYQRQGTVDFLRELGVERGFSVNALELIAGVGTGIISSSQLRECLRIGDMAALKQLLGRAWSLTGTVIKGAGRGKSIGVPTANLDVWSELMIPPAGVYAGFATVGGERFLAATNIGVKPTFGAAELSIEAHLLGFERDIYGAALDLTFEMRLRPERKFDGVAELVAQIQADVAETRKLLGG